MQKNCRLLWQMCRVNTVRFRMAGKKSTLLRLWHSWFIPRKWPSSLLAIPFSRMTRSCRICSAKRVRSERRLSANVKIFLLRCYVMLKKCYGSILMSWMYRMMKMAWFALWLRDSVNSVITMLLWMLVMTDINTRIVHWYRKPFIWWMMYFLRRKTILLWLSVCWKKRMLSLIIKKPWATALKTSSKLR